MKATITSKPLTGNALLSRIQEMPQASRREKARACGYTSYTKNGRERVNLMPFYNAVLGAKDIKLAVPQTTRKRGRELTYRTSVHKNGNIVIGAGYTQQLDLHPGDEFELKLGTKRIQLQKVV
jgi:hypothetical protein